MLYTIRLWSPLISGYFSPTPKSEEAKVSYLCTPIDIDFNLHLNATVYGFFSDAGRRHLIKNLGFIRTCLKNKWSPIVVDTRVRFYKEIPLWRKFTVTTRIIRTYEKSFIMESRFESKEKLHCVALELGYFIKKGGRIPSAQLMDLLPEFITQNLPPIEALDVKSLDHHLFEILSERGTTSEKSIKAVEGHEKYLDY